MTDNLISKSSAKFACEKCDYTTSRKSQFDRHVLTLKHKNTDKILTNTDTEGSESSVVYFECNCGKKYKHRQSLFSHKKKCNINEENVIEQSLNVNNNPKNDKLVEYLIKENLEFKNLILEVMKNGSINNSHNTSNSHNKTFNLNMFLNETCKNAMNINEFADSLQLQISDLENVGEVGYIEGISSIIIKKLNTLDITERPIHCTDKKRETMYIKHENKWEKEDEKKTKMHKLVTKVANKNITLISEFQKLHPEWKKCSSKYADQHNKIVIESMGGKGDNEYEKQEKIIKKIAKEVFVEKCL
jgi:hypothetical protein